MFAASSDVKGSSPLPERGRVSTRGDPVSGPLRGDDGGSGGFLSNHNSGASNEFSGQGVDWKKRSRLITKFHSATLTVIT